MIVLVGNIYNSHHFTVHFFTSFTLNRANISNTMNVDLLI